MRFIDEIGARARGPGRVYLVGGSSALLLGIRDQTIDVDLKLDPEPPAVFEAIAYLKDELSLNVELAAPDDFLPALPTWQDRSEFIIRKGLVDFYHYDFYGQCLAKVLRGHKIDISDARAFVKLGKVDTTKLSSLFQQIQPMIIRYPSIDAKDFEARLKLFLIDMDREAAP
jgi:hypothetical protein